MIKKVCQGEVIFRKPVLYRVDEYDQFEGAQYSMF
jgi:hypothetical protein